MKLNLCEKCDGVCSKEFNRYFITSDIEERLTLCKFGRIRLLQQECGRCQIPNKYAEFTFNDYEVTTDNERAVGLAKRFCKLHETKGLFLYGAPGTGKTFLASLIGKDFILSFNKVVFGDIPTLLDEIKNTFGEQGRTQEVIDRYSDCDLLILDDLGAGHMTDWSLGIIYQIINARYNGNRPIIVTSNFDLNGLQKRLAGKDKFSAERIISRLSEMCTPALLGTNDRRRKKC